MQPADLEKYLHVKTGADLVTLGVVPKSSSRHLALIAALRLEAIRDAVQKGITPEMLGEWIPAIAADEQKIGPVIRDHAKILEYAKPGMRVRGIGISGAIDLSGLEGKVLKTRDPHTNVDLEIEWSNTQEGGNRSPSPSPNSVELVLDAPITLTSNYRLAEDVVADAQLGHKVHFAAEYRGKTGGGELVIPKGMTGMLTGYEEKKGGSLKVQLDTPVGKDSAFNLPLDEQLYHILRASSLGQHVPLDLETEVRRQTVGEFFPRTRFAQGVAEQVLTGMLMGRDQILYGPAGAGKSSLGKDIIRVAMQQELSFIVEGCQAQCNPYSVFDPAFAEICPPCPECMIRYDDQFKKTGRFQHPEAKRVNVVPTRYTHGFGIETKEGTTGLKRYHFSGHKLPKLDGSTTEGRESDFDPEGYHAGFLVRTNNGILFIEEGDKLRPDVLDNILEALESDKTEPDQLRFSYPANAVVLMSANDGTVFSGPLRDRMRMVFIGYPTDVDTSYQITRVAYHGERSNVGSVTIPNSHPLAGNGIRRMPIPAPLERAMDALMINFRANYDAAKRDQILGTNRCKFDALDAARAMLFFDQQFQADAPVIPDARYLMRGFTYAVQSRIAEPDTHKREAGARELAVWTKTTLDATLAEEEKVWWCKVNQHMSIAEARVRGIGASYARELKEYTADPRDALEVYRRLLSAHQKPEDRAAQASRAKHPFMEYLFRNQPALKTAADDQVVALVKYFTDSRTRALPKAPE